MSKSALLVSATILAGCASTSGWRALTVDGSSRSAFEESVTALQQALPENRRQNFDLALADIWIAGTLNAAADGSGEYTAEEYFARLDGLEYRDVIEVATSSGFSLAQSAPSRRSRAPAGVSAYQPPNQSGGFTETGGGFNRDGSRTDVFDPADWRP